MSYPPGGSPYQPPPSLPPEPWTAGYPPANPNQTSTLLAVGSLVTGVFGLLNCACCVFLPMPFVSIALGVIALTQKPNQSGRVMAIIGITLSALILVVFFGSMAFVMLNQAANKGPFIQP